MCCDVLFCDRLYCSVLNCALMYCAVMLSTVISCFVINFMVIYLLQCTVIYLLHCTFIYCNVLYCTVIYCTALYCDVHFYYFMKFLRGHFLHFMPGPRYDDFALVIIPGALLRSSIYCLIYLYLIYGKMHRFFFCHSIILKLKF